MIKWVHENLFQFYLSSIKRRTHSPDLPKQCSFNSTLVQLKVEGATPYFGVGDSFNSTLVQLKDTAAVRKNIQVGSFNSTLVQLKVIKPASIAFRSSSFQFYLRDIQ